MTSAEAPADSNAMESSLLDLLNDLTSTQDELLELLSRKREHMAKGLLKETEASHADEERLRERLFQCHQRRGALLQSAAASGKPSGSLRELAQAMDGDNHSELKKKVQESQNRIRLLQHESLANWVVAQRALLHIAKVIEIMATGGSLKPTYDSGETASMRGNLINEEA